MFERPDPILYPLEPQRKSDRSGEFLTMIALAVLIVGVLLATAGGCRTSTPNGDTQSHITQAYAAIERASEPLIRAELRRETIVQNVQRAVDAAKDQPKVTEPLVVAMAQGVAMAEDHGAIKARLADVGTQLSKAKTAADENDAKLNHLRNQWYVTWGIWIEKALWTIGLIWLACGVLSVLAGFGPMASMGWVMAISKEIVRFVPIMNPFAWIRDYLMARKALAATDSQTAVKP